VDSSAAVVGMPDRRTVLTGGSAAALGLSSLLLPGAASAASPDTQGGATNLRVLSSSSYSTLQIAAPNGSAPLFRSFQYGTNRYFVDLVNGKLVCFSSTGTWIETVAIPDAPLGFTDPLNQSSSLLGASRPTAFLVVGNAAYTVFTIRTFSPSVRIVRAMRLTLTVSNGATTVATAFKDLDVSADRDAFSGLSGLVQVSDELHCLLSARNSSFVQHLDRIRIPIETSWSTAISRDLLGSGAGTPSRLNAYDAVTVPPSAPTHALFFGEGDDPVHRVPLTGTPGYTSLSIDVPVGIRPPSYSYEWRYGSDRYAAVDGNDLYLATTAYAGGVDRAALLRFDLASAASASQLTATALTLAGSGAGYASAVARDGGTIYLAIEYGFDFGNPSSGNWREDGSVAKFETTGGSLTWVATASVGISADPPWHYPLTLQAVTTGVLSGGVGGTAEGGQGATDAPVVVLVGQ
jgi:hypothetical protein